MIEQINTQDNFNISINNNQSNNSINSSALSNSIKNNDIINQLIEFGYSSLYSKRIFQYYHPKNIQEAVDYLSFEDGKIQHVFVQDRNNNENSICYLCGEQKDIHLPDQIDNSLSEDIKSSIRKSFLENRSKLKKSNGSIKKTNCPACEEDFIPTDKNTLKYCGHSFCDECWYDFLSIKIKENKLNFIKCMDYECREKPDDDFIINLLNSNQELINKYKRFKLELEIINNPNRKFCPFPNCNSFLELKDKNNKEVKCSNNHIFCFLCLKSPHGNLPCNNEINKSMVEYEKNNFVKKCPKCDIITEKITGCNHITCAKCNYQWCWLCNGEYDPEHFYEGKCRGLQFFRPKDENEIKLAQEGKIELRESQRQDDLDSENNDDEHFVVNNFNNSNLFNSFNIINIDRSENNNIEQSVVNSIGNNENNNIEQSIVNSIGNNENNNIEQSVVNSIGNNENNNIEKSIVNSIGNNENNNIEKSLVNSIGNNENNNIEKSIVNSIGNNENNNIEKSVVNSIGNNENNNIQQSIVNSKENNKNNISIVNKNEINKKVQENKKNKVTNFKKYTSSIIMKIRIKIIQFISKNKQKNKPIYISCNNNNKNNKNPQIDNNNKNKSSAHPNQFNKSFSQDDTFYSMNNSLSSETKNNKNDININIDSKSKDNKGKSYTSYSSHQDSSAKTRCSTNRKKNYYENEKDSRKDSSKEKFKKQGKIKEEKPYETTIINFNISHSILITFIYLIFGHFFIPINIYLIEANLEKSTLILTSIILINIPFFFIQIIINLILMTFYIKIIGYKLFLTEFYKIIKMKKKIYKMSFITYNAYHILVVLFLGTFRIIIKSLQQCYENKIFDYILGFILGLMLLPLHIIINPFLLYYAIKNNKKKEENEFKLLYEYIYDI